ARAVAADPAVLLLDEPTSAADREVRAAVAEAVNSLAAERGVAVCVATHQIEDAYRWSDRIVTLQGGALSPVVPENCFRVLLPGGSGVQRVAVGPVAFDVMSDRSGPAVLLVPPEEIVLSEAPLHSSARNTVPGRIVRVSEQGDAVRVTIDAGVELVALVTRASYEALGLGLGRQVVASFKSVAVRVV
ncbi:MAG TPA: TOBE domain-containing protein, partial [Gemmatimonadales bacterium]|nr:TOBE domain-containing protein [Gemmatimonadales bacterium]